MEARSAADEQRKSFSSSEYSKAIHGIISGEPPAIDLHAEKALNDCLVALAAERAVQSAHDVSDGGLAVTLAECCFGSDGLSADANLQTEDPSEYALFEESGNRAVVSVHPDALARIEQIAAQYKVEARRIGTVTSGEFCIQLNGHPVIRSAGGKLCKIWNGSLETSLKKE